MVHVIGFECTVDIEKDAPRFGPVLEIRLSALLSNNQRQTITIQNEHGIEAAHLANGLRDLAGLIEQLAGLS